MRHHAIDWNFVGTPRARPNKWRIKGVTGEHGQTDEWVELAFANDESGEPYYHETWRRLDGGAGRPTLALRACASPEGRDALVLVVGSFFGYVRARSVDLAALNAAMGLGTSLVGVVDEAIARGERGVAEACVLLEAGHGTVTTAHEWRVDSALQPWRVGRPLDDVFAGAVDGEEGEAAISLAAAVTTLGRAGGEELTGRRVRIGRQQFDVLSSWRASPS